MKITFLGHSGFLIEMGGKRIVIDPFITPNDLAKNVIDFEALQPDYILLTHGHADHVADTVPLAKQNGALVVSNFEVVNWFAKQGLKGHPLNPGGKKKFDFGTVKYVTAIHSSSMPDGSNGGNPGGFVIWDDDVCFYIAGDTALTLDMKLIPLTCPMLDFSILPIGDNFTMGYEDAVIASDFVECDRVIGCHYDTFGYIVLDKEKALEAFESKGKVLVLPEIGETLEY